VEALLVSTGIVALAEMGDKTQLLALLLAARFRKPLPIIGGILVATLLNHALAAAVGVWVTRALGEDVMRWVLGFSFLAMAVWMLIPDRAPETQPATPRLGVFGTTLIAFFLLEMGDKTQIATVALAAEYPSYFMVVAGTTLGMMLANTPAVMLGDRVTRQLPIRTIQIVCALIFAALGVGALAELKIR
jgi:putative Ca2+/H+ antiporter (TMEM165/GDT1 family)